MDVHNERNPSIGVSQETFFELYARILGSRRPSSCTTTMSNTNSYTLCLTNIASLRGREDMLCYSLDHTHTDEDVRILLGTLCANAQQPIPPGRSCLPDYKFKLLIVMVEQPLNDVHLSRSLIPRNEKPPYNSLGCARMSLSTTRTAC
jgi:hypothetical protein